MRVDRPRRSYAACVLADCPHSAPDARRRLGGGLGADDRSDVRRGCWREPDASSDERQCPPHVMGPVGGGDPRTHRAAARRRRGLWPSRGRGDQGRCRAPRRYPPDSLELRGCAPSRVVESLGAVHSLRDPGAAPTGPRPRYRPERYPAGRVRRTDRRGDRSKLATSTATSFSMSTAAGAFP